MATRAAAAAAAAEAAESSSSGMSRVAVTIPRRRLSSAAAADHHGPAKVNIWEDPLSPSKWKEEHAVSGVDQMDCDMDCSQNSGVASNQREKQQEAKRMAVHAEIARVNQLPANSGYAIHRMRVLNKLLQLMSIPRTTLQDEELELLFASLSL